MVEFMKLRSDFLMGRSLLYLSLSPILCWFVEYNFDKTLFADKS